MQELNEAEMFRAVLNEMLEEMKQVHRTIKEMKGALAVQQEKIDGFQRQLENIQVVAPPTDLQPLKDQFAAGVSEFSIMVKETLAGMKVDYGQQLQKVTQVLEAQPKPIVRRISLFPENDHHGNFKYFFKCLFLSILGFGLLAMIYALVQQRLEQGSGYQPAPYQSSRSFTGSSSAPSVPKASGGHSKKRDRPHSANISKDTTIPRGDSFASSSNADAFRDGAPR